MTSPDDGELVSSPQSHPSVNLHIPKIRVSERDESPGTSTTSLPLRGSSPSTSILRPSLSPHDLSRTGSPNGRLSRSASNLGRSPSPKGPLAQNYDEIRSLLVRAFSPTIAVYASAETDELARSKGFAKGFSQLLRPYGETIVGKVVVRDSVGASRAWDDFGIHFVDLAQLVDKAFRRQDHEPGHDLGVLEDVLERYIERSPDNAAGLGVSQSPDGRAVHSEHHGLFLRRLLSSHRLSPHETFAHPAACVIAIGSSLPAPIETLRQLYAHTAQGSKTLPPFVDPDYLRYYVLVHDDDRDDFIKSSALFDQMKRHFGLHCHLLRLNSRPVSSSDGDGVPTPAYEWLSPAEELERLEVSRQPRYTNGETHPATGDERVVLPRGSAPLLLESNVTAIKSFVRELVAQSVVPHMENRVALWNEQVASRRRGISGRFMSLSKRWTGIGSISRNASTPMGPGGGASGNYDSLQGFYRFDTPEATLRKMADYAFMLRDHKLASSTYELLRTDYGNDKAWRYLAGANEMCAVGSLLSPLTASAKSRLEGYDQMLETASYSYLTRCSDPINALRCMSLGVELLKVRGREAAEIAAKWAIRILELDLVGSVGHVLISERVASCFSAQISSPAHSWSSWKRKAALWNVITADEWMKLGRADLAADRLEDADFLYNGVMPTAGLDGFREMSSFLQQLGLAIRIKLRREAASAPFSDDTALPEQAVEEVTEHMSEQRDSRSHRTSLAMSPTPLGLVPLSPVHIMRSDPLSRGGGGGDDDFE